MKPLSKRRIITLAIQWTVALGAIWFIFRQIQLKNRSHDILDDLRSLVSTDAIPFLFILVSGMVLNWGLEAYKWEVLLRGKEDVRFIKSFKAILSGVTIAVCTPNRMGEYAGRVFHLEKADRIDGLLLTVVGSYAQLLTTIIAGLLALIFYLPRFVGLGFLGPYRFYIMAITVVIFCILLVLLYLNSHLITAIIDRLQLPPRFRKYGKVFQLHGRSDLIRVLLASMGRYAVFSSQFLLLLYFFEVDVQMGQGLMMIGMSYLVMSAIPTIAITELGIRGTVSLYFLGQLSDNMAGIVSASSVLWLINLIIPALLGVVFIFEMRFFRK